MRGASSRPLFDESEVRARSREPLADGGWILRAFAVDRAESLIAAIDDVAARAPFRHMTTPGGFRMSVAMTNCGDVGWVTDRTGYRYDGIDPDHERPWPPMPDAFLELARSAARTAGYPGFQPDACLINEYLPGAALSLHQDRNERDFGAPIVSLSLGLPATFMFGGLKRTDRAKRMPLFHGDVAVWGGASRLAFHGVAKLKDGEHSILGRRRLNVTLRKAR
jgi:DNA oxidative demethylase